MRVYYEANMFVRVKQSEYLDITVHNVSFYHVMLLCASFCKC